MSRIETTLIERYSIDRERIAERFSLWCIGYREYAGREQRTRMATLARDIYASGPVLALHRYGREQACYVLTPKGACLELGDPRLTCTSRDIVQEQHGWLLACLLIKALPSQLPELALQEASRFEAEGLYYLVRQRKLQRSESPQLVAVEVAMQPQKLDMGRQQLKIAVQTFTPLDALLNQDGELSARLRRKPRYRLDRYSQLLHKSLEGDYLKCSLPRQSRQRIPMLDLGKQSLSDYQCCKLGIFSLFLEDLQRAYAGALSLELQQIQVDERYQPTPAVLKREYAKIDEILRDWPLYIIDTLGTPDTVAALREALQVRGFAPQQVDTPKPGACHLLIVPPAERFEAEPERDPYRQIKRAHADAVIQACTVEKLLPEGQDEVSPHVLDVLLKELLFKLELQQGRQLLDGYPIPPDALFVLPWRLRREEDEEEEQDEGQERPAANLFLTLEQRDGRLHVERLEPEACLARVDALDTSLLRRLRSPYWAQANIPLVYWPSTGDVLAFIDSEAVALADFRGIGETLRALAQGRSQRIPTELLRAFRAANPVLDQAGVVLDALLSQDYDSYGYAELQKIPAKGSGKLLFAWLEDALGAPLKAVGLQGQDGPLERMTGLNLDTGGRLYFAGSVGSPQRRQENFSHLYHLYGTHETVPEEILRLMQPLHIRHKGLTVHPLPFKYLREVGQVLELQGAEA